MRQSGDSQWKPLEKGFFSSPKLFRFFSVCYWTVNKSLFVSFINCHCQFGQFPLRHSKSVSCIHSPMAVHFLCSYGHYRTWQIPQTMNCLIQYEIDVFIHCMLVNMWRISSIMNVSFQCHGVYLLHTLCSHTVVLWWLLFLFFFPFFKVPHINYVVVFLQMQSCWRITLTCGRSNRPTVYRKKMKKTWDNIRIKYKRWWDDLPWCIPRLSLKKKKTLWGPCSVKSYSPGMKKTTVWSLHECTM